MEYYEIILLIVAFLCLILGVIGSFAPVLPGPLLGMIGILLMIPTSSGISLFWVVIFVGLTVISMATDYYLPIRWTKKYWWTKRGIIWSTIGLLIGIFVVPPFGMIILPMVGAFIGEYAISRLTRRQAFKAARWSLVGFMLGTGYKFILSAWMFVAAIVAVVK